MLADIGGTAYLKVMRWAAAVSLLVLGCSGGSSGGGGGQSPPPDPVPCQPGDFDLGSVVGPGQRGLITPGTVELTEPVQIVGQSGVQSAPVSVCVPDDAVSLLLFPDPSREALPSSYVASGYGEQVDTSSVDALIRFVTPEVMLPRSRELPLQPGRHVFRIADTTMAPVAPVLALRRGNLGAQAVFSLNLKFVDGAFQNDSELQTAFQDASIFDSIYGAVGVGAVAVGAGTISDTSLAVLPDTELAKLATAPATSLPEGPLLPNAVEIYFVRELVSQDSAGALLGKAMGIPGAPGVPNKQGVAISVDAHRVNGQILASAMWTTVAHEVGHWFGLRHPTERTGRTFDYVADTPECPASRDLNHDGLVDSSECNGAGADNLMFWFYDFYAPPSGLTQGQAFVLHSSLMMEAQ